MSEPAQTPEPAQPPPAPQLSLKAWLINGRAEQQNERDALAERRRSLLAALEQTNRDIEANRGAMLTTEKMIAKLDELFPAPPALASQE